MTRGRDADSHQFAEWLPYYRTHRIRLALEAVARVGSSYAEELDREDRAHRGRLAQRRRELEAAIGDYIDAKRQVEDYDEIELRAWRSIFDTVGGKIPD